MNKKITIIMVLMLLVFALNGCKGVNTSETYTNEKFGFIIELPDDWEGKYQVDEIEEEKYSMVTFLYNGYEYENGSLQEFFSIVIYDEKTFDEMEGKNEEEILAKKEGKVFYYSSPLDCGLPMEEGGEEFYKLNIINHIKVKELFSIY